ncbi:MAG: acyl--CoA ligase [Chloroflexi bacterium]|nr:acyl--CoA ligase [Chloroflexota bacterium]MBM3176028.1 acyl--CoA ligase [Chloroflexota bacterium]MBM4449530.1 acyl--CoA ligase [Chloroflexota bacterium]
MESKFSFENKKIGNAVVKVYADRPRTVYEMFSNTAGEYPAREAVKFGDICLTYQELGQRVDAIAFALSQDYGVRKGDRVALFLKNDDSFPIVFLAISKLGAISVVLNTRLKKAELEYQLDLTKPLVAVVDGEIWDAGLDSLIKHKMERGALEQIWKREGICPPADGDEDDIHTLLFTSGTTGKPKAVQIVHRNFIHSAIRMEQYMTEVLRIAPPQSGGKTLIAAPLFHVMGLQEQLISCLKMGNTSILLSALSITAFLELVEKERVEFLVGSPAIYRILLGSEEVGKYDLSSVKIAGFGAAPMSPDLMALMKKAFVNAKFFNGFGLTEASISLAAIDHECIEKPTSIGHPSLGCQAKIVDENMKEVPRGTVGEIAVNGPNVAAGYYHDPEATERAFREGWFLTGDLGRVDEDGFFYVVSRKKDMINRGGENVYPVEVENAICLHPKVLEVAVYGVPDKVMGEKVAASIVVVPGTELTAEEVKQFCSDKLAKYKIPEYIVFTSMLPKNPGGKVIKEELTSQLSQQIGKG